MLPTQSFTVSRPSLKRSPISDLRPYPPAFANQNGRDRRSQDNRVASPLLVAACTIAEAVASRASRRRPQPQYHLNRTSLNCLSVFAGLALMLPARIKSSVASSQGFALCCSTMGRAFQRAESRLEPGFEPCRPTMSSTCTVSGAGRFRCLLRAQSASVARKHARSGLVVAWSLCARALHPCMRCFVAVRSSSM